MWNNGYRAYAKSGDDLKLHIVYVNNTADVVVDKIRLALQLNDLGAYSPLCWWAYATPSGTRTYGLALQKTFETGLLKRRTQK